MSAAVQTAGISGHILKDLHTTQTHQAGLTTILGSINTVDPGK